jgi:hypothetical protein
MQDIVEDDLVLIAICRGPRDLEIARLLGWYRIPLASAPKTLRVDWLAFFQTAAFGEERWSVRHVAPVRGYELRRRGELFHDEPDHPRADEPYYRIDLGPLQALARPIPARRWRRVTFLYTTGERLLSAEDVGDLGVPVTKTDDRLWRLLRSGKTKPPPAEEPSGIFRLSSYAITPSPSRTVVVGRRGPSEAGT